MKGKITLNFLSASVTLLFLAIGIFQFRTASANDSKLSVLGVTSVNSTTTLNLNVYIQGYYIGYGQMQAALLYENVDGATGAETDTITVELRSSGTPNVVLESAKAVLMTDGTASAEFSESVAGQTYWICVKHRNTVQAWSAMPFTFSSTPTSSYDFTTSPTATYGSNVKQLEYNPDFWGFYNGDMWMDENIDLIDFPPLDKDIRTGAFGYVSTDLNGDGNVDILDFPILNENVTNGIFSLHP